MAASFKPVSISKGGFAFCRAVIAGLVVLSAVPILHLPMLAATFTIMAVSAILRVRRAPLILLYKYTIEKFHSSGSIIVDENGIFFSHIVGSVFSVVCLLAFRANTVAGIIVTCLFAILQISAACGFCSALKLYTCMVSGHCCRFGRKIKTIKDRTNA